MKPAYVMDSKQGWESVARMVFGWMVDSPELAVWIDLELPGEADLSLRAAQSELVEAYDRHLDRQDKRGGVRFLRVDPARPSETRALLEMLPVARQVFVFPTDGRYQREVGWAGSFDQGAVVWVDCEPSERWERMCGDVASGSGIDLTSWFTRSRRAPRSGR